ncbi:MAG: Cytidine deaminase [uncultured Rubrobacteraceae bacterium]|uniref:Cytidine deaminase n=1 Tax=uncultured Rubrobacteraceae bacterium TaxID=349277 RepID=A0A6J4PDW9_9ACTN|nr:MAG: Cytidine deaminase [uncultured Rubrobacteraceae bacterium]
MDLSHVIEAARAASSKAYAPYSNFRVGAAILTGSGAVYAGCNVENASYGLAICAERNAVARMVADAADADDRKIQLVAVVSPDAAPCFPCGACRQVLHEFGCEEVVVLDTSGNLERYPFHDILPHAFGPEDL